MIAIFWTAARKVGQHSPCVQPTWWQMKHPPWQISSEACWQEMARCREGPTFCRLLRVINVHQNCTSTGRLTHTNIEMGQTVQRQESVLLHPGEFRFDTSWEPAHCRLCVGFLKIALGKNIQADIISSVLSFMPASSHITSTLLSKTL